MPDFEWIFNKLVSEETPLALGFAGMMMAGGLFLLIHATLSRMGVVGTGKVEKRNQELESEKMRLMSENAALAVDKARFEERCNSLDAQMAQMSEAHEREIEAEKLRSQTLIKRVEEIAELEERVKTRRRRKTPT